MHIFKSRAANLRLPKLLASVMSRLVIGLAPVVHRSIHVKYVLQIANPLDPFLSKVSGTVRVYESCDRFFRIKRTYPHISAHIRTYPHISAQTRTNPRTFHIANLVNHPDPLCYGQSAIRNGKVPARSPATAGSPFRTPQSLSPMSKNHPRTLALLKEPRPHGPYPRIQ
jgi:hypothetical protein